MKVVLVLAAFVVLTNANKLEPKIVGGETAEDGQFPYQVYLRKGRKQRFYCGGSILSERWILTAAHCLYGIDPSRITVVAGTNFLSEGGETYEVESVLPLGWFDGEPGSRYDIGLIKVRTDIQFNNKVQPIAINREEIGIGEELVLSGWGWPDYPGSESNELLFVKLLTISTRDCDDIISPYVIDETQICTFTQVGQGICSGDSGGPLVYKGKVAGVVSYGAPCAVGTPDVHTRVSAYADWIEAHMENH